MIGKDPSYGVSPYYPHRMPIYPNLLVNIKMGSPFQGVGGSVKIETAILVENYFGLKKAYVQMSEEYIISPASDMNTDSETINSIINRLKERIVEASKYIKIDSLTKQKQTN